MLIDPREDVIAHGLNQVAEMVEQQNFIPPATTLLALRRINSAIARAINAHNAFVDDKGNAVSKDLLPPGPQTA